MFAGSPGSLLFLIPSMPAWTQAANVMYGLHEGSGDRSSTRRPLGWEMGIRMLADRFRPEYAMKVGASYPGTSRRYELVMGFAKAAMAGMCFIRPPMKYSASWESPSFTSPVNMFF